MTHARARIATLAEIALVLALALAVRAPLVGQELSNDELYHVLAARQYLVDGTFTLARGAPYERASGFTGVVAESFALFGESPTAARLPALLAGALTAALAFAWLRAAGARGAAFAAGLLVALDPELVRLSQMCRFYTPQHLLFLAGLVGIDAAFAPARRVLTRAAFAALAVLGFFCADALQEATRVGFVGVGVFVGLVAAGSALRRRLAPARIALLVAGVSLAAAIAGAAALRSGFAARQLEGARYVDLWAQQAASSPRFYHHWLVADHPTLWPLFPLAAVAALALRPRPGLLCACVFGVGITLHSLLAMKSPRYVAYLLPPFFVVSGLALALLLPAFERLAERVATATPFLGERPRLVRAAGLGASFALLLFLLATNGAFAETVRLVLADPSYRDSITATNGPTVSWRRAAEVLRPEVAKAEIVIGTDAMKTLYHLGRIDVEMNLTHQHEDIPLDQPPRPDFTIGEKLGIPLVTQPASVARLLDCHHDGMFVAQTGFFVADWVLPPATRALLLARTEPIELPEAWGVMARRWRTPVLASDCPSSLPPAAPGAPHAR